MSKIIYGKRVFQDEAATTVIGTSSADDRFEVISTTSRIAIGSGTVTTGGANAIAIGAGATALTNFAETVAGIAIGHNATNSNQGIAIGDTATSNTDAVALGHLTTSANNSATVNTSGVAVVQATTNEFGFYGTDATVDFAVSATAVNMRHLIGTGTRNLVTDAAGNITTADTPDLINDWVAATAYPINAEITALSPTTGHITLYRATAAFTSSGTWNAAEEANWTTVATSGEGRVFADDTSLAPAIAGEPTTTEIEAFATARNFKDGLIYYTGGDDSTNTPTYAYWVDAAGVVTTMKEPSAADTFYSADDTLTGNRTVTQNTSSLTFSGTSQQGISISDGTGEVNIVNDSVNDVMKIISDETRIAIGSGTVTTVGTNTIAIGASADASAADAVSIGRSAGSSSGTVSASAVSIGYQANGSSTSDIGTNSVAIGRGAKSSNLYAISMGYLAGSTTGTVGQVATSLGPQANNGTSNIGTGSVAVGYLADSIGSGSVAMGQSAISEGQNSVAIGKSAEGSNLYSVSMGYLAGNTSGSVGQTATSIGPTANSGTSNIGGSSVAVGASADSIGASSVSVGDRAVATGSSAVCIGKQSNATGTQSVAVGQGASAAGNSSFAMGSTANAANNSCVAIGSSAEADADNGTAFGAGAAIHGTSGVSIGYRSGATTGTVGANTVTIGADANKGTHDVGTGSIAIGFDTFTQGTNAIAIGRSTTASANSSMCINSSGASKSNTVANTAVFHVNGASDPDFGVRSGAPEIPVYTVATLPSAVNSRASLTGLICVSDETGGRTLATSDGTNWRRVNDGAVVS